MAQVFVAPPVVIVELRLEEKPRVLIAAQTDGQEQRIWQWIDSHAEYRDLVERALELAGDTPAA